MKSSMIRPSSWASRSARDWMARTQFTARISASGSSARITPRLADRRRAFTTTGNFKLGKQFPGIFSARQVMEFGTQEFPFLEQPAERQLVAHPAHRLGGISRQAKTLREQGRKLHSRIVHRQHRIRDAVRSPANGVRRLLRLVEMQRHDGSAGPRMAPIGGSSWPRRTISTPSFLAAARKSLLR